MGDWLGKGIKKQPAPPILLTPSIDNGCGSIEKPRRGEGGESIHGLLVNKAVVSRETDDN